MLEVKYRAHRPIKHMLADQFAYVERDLRGGLRWCLRISDFGETRAVRQLLACEHTLPPRFGLVRWPVGYGLLCITAFI